MKPLAVCLLKEESREGRKKVKRKEGREGGRKAIILHLETSVTYTEGYHNSIYLAPRKRAQSRGLSTRLLYVKHIIL